MTYICVLKYFTKNILSIFFHRTTVLCEMLSAVFVVMFSPTAFSQEMPITLPPAEAPIVTEQEPWIEYSRNGFTGV